MSLGSLFGITRRDAKNSDPWDRFVCPYLTLLSDSYIRSRGDSNDVGFQLKKCSRNGGLLTDSSV